MASDTREVPIMILDFLANYSWIVWLALILIFGIIEMATLQFIFLMLALGSLGGLVTGLFGVPWWVQVIVAAVVAILLLFAVRPPLLRRLGRGGDPARSNVDALLGLTGVVTNDFSGNASHVKLTNGETWTAKLTEDRALVEGERVVVTAIDGATAVVAPAERTAS
jgi:membrane protein implicated in regulation of membrane protease activity